MITNSLKFFASASLALPAVGADLSEGLELGAPLHEDDGPFAEVPELRDKAAPSAAEHLAIPGPEGQLHGEPAARPEPAHALAIDGAKAKQLNLANHDITHFPLLHDCVICQQSKQRRAPARATDNSQRAKPVSFGDRLQCDHIVQLKESLKGIHQEGVSMQLSDEATRFKAAYPAASKHEESNTKAIRHFLGGQARAFKRLRSDNAPELISTLKQFPSVVHELAIPHAHETHGKKEREPRGHQRHKSTHVTKRPQLRVVELRFACLLSWL